MISSITASSTTASSSASSSAVTSSASVCHGVRTHSRLLGGRFGRFLFRFERLGDIFLVAVGQCFLCL